MKKIQSALVLVTLILCLTGCTTSAEQNAQNSTLTPTEQPFSEKKDELNKEFVEKNEEATVTPVPTEEPIVPAFSEEELAAMVNTNQTNGEYEYFIRWNAEWSYYIELVRCFEATIPAYIDGIPVKVLGSGSYPIYESDGTFYFLTVPEGVAYISNYALRDSRNLKKVKLPDSVISIGEGAFSGTPWESSLEEEYTIVGDGILYAANLDKNAKTATIPDGVKRIYDEVFYDYTALEQIEIPGSVISIGKNAFGTTSYGTKWYKNLTDDFVIVGDGVLIKANVDGVAELVLPDGVKDISYGLFEEHETLESIVLPEGITVIPEGVFFSCDALRSVTLPNSLKYIEADAFADCFYLEEITIPESVIRIDISSFERKLWRYDNLNVIGKAGSYAEQYVNEYTKYNEGSYIKGITMTFQVGE